MTKQTVNIGTTANDQSADTIRIAFDKVNDNFNELYSAFGTDSPTTNQLKFVADDSTGVSMSLNETFKISGGPGITTSITGDELTITAAATGEPITFVGDDSTGIDINSGNTLKITGTNGITATASQVTGSGVITLTGSSAFSTIQVADNTDVTASTSSDTLTFVGGDNVVIQTSGNTITFHSTGNIAADDSTSFDDIITGEEGRLAYYVETGNTLAQTGSSVEYDAVTGNFTATNLITNTVSSTDSSVVTVNDGLIVTGNFAFDGGVAVSTILDEDAMSSDSATALATQQSIKAYVDTQIGAVSTTLGISDSSSNTGSVATGTNDLEFRSGNSVTATVSGTGVTFDINDSITVDDITAKDSTAININSPIQVTGNINTDTSLTVTGTTITQILDEDNLVSNSATALATQQSIKAYIDANAGGVLTMGDSASNSGSVASGSGQDLEFRSGDGITLTVSGNGVTATLNKIIDVNEISSSDSTAVQINEGLNVSGALFVNGAVSTNSTISTATGSTVGTLTLADGSITDSSGTISFDNENLTTTGTVTGSTVITNTVQSSDSTVVNINDGLKVEGGLNVQGGAEIYGTLYAQAVGAEDSTQLSFVSDIQINGTSSTINDLTITTNNLDTVTISTQGNEDLVLNADTDNIRVEANLTQFTSNVQIDGNLTVNGTETIVNTTNLQIEDNQIVLARNNSADVVDIGFFGHTYPAGFDSTVPNHVGLFRDATNSEWYLIATYSKNEDQTTIDRADPSFGLATLNTLNINTGDVTATGSFIIGSASMNETDLEKLDGITNGTGTANKALVLDGSSNISTGGNITSNGITAGNIRVGITGDNEIDTASGNLTIDSAGGTVTVDDNLIVSGNLTVNGASTTVNTTNTFIEDTLLALNNGVSASANTYDAGILINRGTGTDSSTINVAMIWDESANQFAMIETTEDGTTAGDINITRYANLQVDRLTGTATQAQYADLAEMYSADADYEPGTVMIFGGDKEITQSTITHDSRTAGVVSTDPAHLMNATLENGTAIALQGRVPCKVKGIVRKGDLITTSNIPGVGTKMNKDLYEIGCVIGKALEDHNSAEQGVIEVVVGRV
jgi:sporulation protein YlmC with PRC-barrel domain